MPSPTPLSLEGLAAVLERHIEQTSHLFQRVMVSTSVACWISWSDAGKTAAPPRPEACRSDSPSPRFPVSPSLPVSSVHPPTS